MTYERKSFRSYELQKPRDEYKFRVGHWWGHEVDTFWTDDEQEVLELVSAGLEQLYSVTIHYLEHQGSPDAPET